MHNAQTLPCKENNLGTTSDSRVLDVLTCTDVDICQSLCTELPERIFKRDLTDELSRMDAGHLASTEG